MTELMLQFPTAPACCAVSFRYIAVQFVLSPQVNGGPQWLFVRLPSISLLACLRRASFVCFIFRSGCDVASLCVYAALALSAAANIADSRQVIFSLAIVPRQKRYIFNHSILLNPVCHNSYRGW